MSNQSLCKFHALCLLILLYLSAPLLAAERPEILLKNARLVVTMDEELGLGELGLVENTDVLISKGKIAKIGKHLSSSTGEVLDVSGKIIMAGFIDLHNHLFQSVMHGCGTEYGITVGSRSVFFLYPEINLLPKRILMLP